MKNIKRYLSLILAIIMCITALPITGIAADENGFDYFAKRNTYKSNTFNDVSADNWFYEDIKAAYELGLMLGKGENTFDTESGVTIAETITIAARIHSVYTTGSDNFEEGTPWYQVYVDYALANGIINNSEMNYTKAATRAEFAVILANALPDEALEATNTVADDAIPDVKISDTYGVAVYKLYRAGILSGNDADGTFAPDSNIKRCEVAAIAARMADTDLRKAIQLGEADIPVAEENTIGTKYTVTFDLNGGKGEIPAQTVAEGKTAEKPNDPSRNKCVFEGWYTKKYAGEEYDFSAPVNEDITLYARWEMDPIWLSILNGWFSGDHEQEQPGDDGDTYTVTFVANADGVIGMPENQKVAAGECAVEPIAPTNLIYEFDGWYTERECIKKFSFDTKITKNITLYAKWNILIYTKDTEKEHIQVYVKEYEGVEYESYYVSNEVIVVLNTDNSLCLESLENVLIQYNGKIVGQIPTVGLYQIEFNKDYSINELETICNNIKQIDAIDDAYCNNLFENDIFNVEFNDPYPVEVGRYPNEYYPFELPREYNTFVTWGLRAANVPQAWKMLLSENKDNKTIRIGVIDYFFDKDHEDLSISIISEKITTPTDSNKYMHGTASIGIWGATRDNNIGITGIALKSDTYGVLLPDQSLINFTKIVEGIAQLIENNCKIINLSIGQPSGFLDYGVKINVSFYAGKLYDSLSKYEKKGFDFLIVQAAGNEGEVDHDVNYSSIVSKISESDIKDNIIVVGNAFAHNDDPDDLNYFNYIDNNTIIQKARSSSYKGDRVDIMAPGTHIYTTFLDDTYEFMYGTSFAAPFITGVAALVWKANENLSAEDVKRILVNTADIDVELSDVNMVNAEAAVASALGYKKVACHVIDDGTNSAIKNAKITLYSDSILNPIEKVFYTDSRGYVEEYIDIPTNLNKAKIEADGYITKIVDIKYSYVNNGYILGEIELIPIQSHTITGQVTDGTSALSGVTVTIASTTDPTAQFSPVTTADDGTYSISVPDGTYTLTFTKDKYQTQTKTGIVVNGGNVTVPTVVMPLTEVNFTITHGTDDILSMGTIEMYNGEGYQTWTITSSHDWTVTKSGNWFTIDKSSGKSGTTTMVITIPNGTDSSREGTLTFTVGENTFTVKICQKANDVTFTITHGTDNILSMDSVEMYNGAGYQTWTITSSHDWTVTKSGNWFTIDKSSGKAGTTTMVITIPNGTDSSREGTLTFTVGENTFTVKICQKANDVTFTITHGTRDVLTQDPFEMYCEVGYLWKITSSHDWSAEESSDLIRIYPTSGTAGTTQFSVIIDGKDNYYNEGDITFTVNGRVFKVNIASRPCIVTGNVIGNDAPVIGATVTLNQSNSLHKKTVYTDTHGAFMCEMPNIPTEVKITADGFPEKTLTLSTVFTNNGNIDLGEIELNGTNDIVLTGAIFNDTKGSVHYLRPIEGVKVEIFDSSDANIGTVISDSNGKFTFAFKSPGYYKATCTKEGYQTVIKTSLNVAVNSSSLGAIGMVEEDRDIIAENACGTNITWTLDDDGVLTLSGFGKTFDYGTVSGVDDQPWYERRSEIKKIIISDGITELGWYNFPRCDNLKEVIIGNSLTNLGKGTFAFCESLEKIVIPDSITYIGWDVFYMCQNLSEVKLSNNLEHIGWHAFYGCKSLESISIPDTVSQIGKNCFMGCTNLKKVYFYGSVPEFVSGEFHDTHRNLVLYYVRGKSDWTSPTWTAPDGTVYNTATFKP